jgi:hypothetical protein
VQIGNLEESKLSLRNSFFTLSASDVVAGKDLLDIKVSLQDNFSQTVSLPDFTTVTISLQLLSDSITGSSHVIRSTQNLLKVLK